MYRSMTLFHAKPHESTLPSNGVFQTCSAVIFQFIIGMIEVVRRWSERGVFPPMMAYLGTVHHRVTGEAEHVTKY